ncbi:MAG: secondary thiamine-phosphate synthase enzyme YjbQ [Elusimicrobia bacterium]|nr:secondary thiamine-phosphate synthase enzyme YjbQ [Elusimicrobiota bacterium]
MKIFSDKISFNTKGNCEIVNITEELSAVLVKSKIKDGIANVFIAGATGAITTIEYEPGLVKDFQNLLKEIVKENGDYEHNKTHSDVNATAHLRASLLGPSISVPVGEGKLTLGKWQQVIFVDMDNRPREREVLVKIIGQ